MSENPQPIKPVPAIISETDSKTPEDAIASDACEVDKTSSQSNITSSFKERLEEKDQSHNHDRDRRVTFWGFVIVCGVLLISAVHAVWGTYLGEQGLFREFFTLASTALSLVLGYLFGSNRK